MKVQRFTLTTQDFGEVKVLRPVPYEKRVDTTLFVDAWGVLSPIRDHVPDVARFVPVVSGEVWSHALHGHARPLMLVLGPEPRALLRMTTVRKCHLERECVMHHVNRCQPNKKMPECWRPKGVLPIAQEAVSLVTLAWAEDRYVVVVEGPEFNLR